jgi:hypothetical protein
MRRLPAALVALTAAATLALLASPASAAGGPRSFTTDADTVRAGQQIKVWGKGLPVPGVCSHLPGVVRSARFNVTPRNVEAGDSVTVRGNLCKPDSYVTIKLGTELIGEDRANDKGNFIGGHRIPEDTSEGAHSVSARCHAKFVGSQLIDVTPSYPAQQNLLTTDRTAVPAGQAVTISGTKCPTGKPSATLDGQRLNLAVNRSANGKGFTASSRMVPRPVDSPVYSGISNDTLTWL